MESDEDREIVAGFANTVVTAALAKGRLRGLGAAGDGWGWLKVGKCTGRHSNTRPRVRSSMVSKSREGRRPGQEDFSPLRDNRAGFQPGARGQLTGKSSVQGVWDTV